jgi:hypothetical protein
MSSSPCARMMHLARTRDQGARVRARVTCRSALRATGDGGPRLDAREAQAEHGRSARSPCASWTLRSSPAWPPSRRRSPGDDRNATIGIARSSDGARLPGDVRRRRSDTMGSSTIRSSAAWPRTTKRIVPAPWSATRDFGAEGTSGETGAISRRWALPPSRDRGSGIGWCIDRLVPTTGPTGSESRGPTAGGKRAVSRASARALLLAGIGRLLEAPREFLRDSIVCWELATAASFSR